jgi:3-deoxy-D-manno-octulosonic-acid transferase
MIWVYRLFFPLLFLVSLPYYLLRMFKRGGYRAMMASRFGNVRIIPRKTGVKRIWIQAVSVGELLAIELMVKQLARLPHIELVITTTTSTGFSLAKEKYGEMAVLISSFPFDFWPIVRKTWSRIDPDLAIITEGELWPEHMRTARDKEIPLILINARLSDRSYLRMKKLKALQALFYSNITRIAASSDLDAQRILDLGYPEENLTVVGNLKFDVIDPQGMQSEEKEQLLREIGFFREGENRGTYIIVGASTWPGEEELLIQSCRELKSKGLQVFLLLTPRHSERRTEIRDTLKRHEDIEWRFRTNTEWVQETEQKEAMQVYVTDTTGELRKFIQLADIAVIGKSFPPHTQGQTPIEAVVLGTPVVYGPSMSNFRAICSDLEENQGSFKVSEAEQLTAGLYRLLMDEKARMRMKAAAKGVFEKSRGSTERTIDLIKSYF